MSSSTLPKICIIGAGAVGGFFGPRLANGHAQVSVVARGRTLDALRSRGWILEGSTERIVAPVRAVADTAELGPQDIVILAVKAYSLPDVAALVPALIGPTTVVVPALNGVPWWFTRGYAGLPVSASLRSVDPDAAIEGVIPTDAVIGSVIYPSCSTPEPGVCRHHSGTRVVFGDVDTPPGAAASVRVEGFVALLKSAGFDAEVSTDIRNEVWKKLLGNACFNPVSLITGSATDLMIDDPRIHALFVAMMEETLVLGRALGIDVPIEPVDRIALTRKLGHVKTSMLQDAEAGRPVEIEAILGAVIELAAMLKVPVPACNTVYTLARMRARTFGLLIS